MIMCTGFAASSPDGEGTSLSTIRGYGYSLTVKPLLSPTPSLQDAELQEAIRGMFSKYHLLGQGRSMLALAVQQETLGFELDPFYRLYLRFLEADIAWFLETDEAPEAERLYWMLLLYRFISPDPRRCLTLLEHALDSRLLTPEQHREVYILNILHPLAETGQHEAAVQRLEETHRIMEENSLEGFRTPVAIAEMYIYLLGDKEAEFLRMEAEAKELLERSPYLREIGCFRIVSGLYLLKKGRTGEGETMLDEGLAMLDLSLNRPMQLGSIGQILLFIGKQPELSALARKYEGIYKELHRSCGFEGLKLPLEEKLLRMLDMADIL